MATKRTEMTQAEADNKFSGEVFRFERTGLLARNLMFEDGQYNSKKVSMEVRPDGGDWEYLQISFRTFLKDQPVLIESKINAK